jgi:hypothetical protein
VKQPQAHRPKVRSHELLVMSKLCELYATLKPERRMRVHEHIGGMLDDLPAVAQVRPAGDSEEMPPLPFHHTREPADDEQAA